MVKCQESKEFWGSSKYMGDISNHETLAVKEASDDKEELMNSRNRVGFGKTGGHSGIESRLHTKAWVKRAKVSHSTSDL